MYNLVYNSLYIHLVATQKKHKWDITGGAGRSPAA